MRKSTAFLLIAIMMMGCTDIEDCQVDPYRQTLLTLWSHDDVIAFDSITIAGFGRIGNDTDTIATNVLYGLPMDFEQNTITYGFYTDSIDYELTLNYSKEIKIFDLSCDPSVRYHGLELISTNLDSAVLVLPELLDNLTNPENIEIYF